MQTSLAQMKEKLAPPRHNPSVPMNMETVGGFESMQRAAKLFSTSTIVPKTYQGNESNCFIAVDMAMRMAANPLMVMQNLYIVHGNPAWSAQFLIATFNKSGRFSSLRYEFQGEKGRDDWGCRAVAMELSTKEKLTGPLITIGLAKKEGWYNKPGSKWQTMPEMMLRYRAAAWFVRAYAPEIAMGLQTIEEVRDATIIMEPGEDGSFEMSMADLESSEESITEPVVETVAPLPVPEESAEAKADSHAETANSKQAADRQRVAKAASRVKAKETAQADLQTMAATPEAIQVEAGDIQCPREGPDGNPRIVSEADCLKCGSRTGCPAWSEEW